MSIIRIHLIFLLLSTPLSAQKIDNTVSYRNIESESYFRFNYDNDYFTATDENYTQGYNFELILKVLEKNPINYLFYKPNSTNSRYGLSLEHIGFTPNDYVSEDIQFGDRPFASAIMLKSFVVSTNSKKRSRLSQSLSLGIIGPGAFGKEMQVGIHKATGNKIPGGWDNQIKNDLIVNYRLDYEKQLFAPNTIFEINTKAVVQLGTLFTNTSVSLNARFGVFNSVLGDAKRNTGFQIYIYSEPVLNLVGYDATLQGGLLNTKSPYTISSNNIERLTRQFNYGLIIKTRNLYFEYTRSEITREFKTGSLAKWGGIRIGFTF
ncbi:lipid A deacylase LpxR family protein [uncultured Winogradskyella sp.]|uniref:lipid A deacylase LpxR family protein n=1 Tax=uncultured Winogradskyella sp. TaxID=395353 RepID=UPI00262EAB74|nr:lipid A deacylase LpxR family protein [uncultured Winogradskyella sp.]